MTPAVETFTNSGTVAAIEGTPLTFGLLIFLAVGVIFIVSAVWTFATIRANDKTGISKEIKDSADACMNAVTRLEKKHDASHEQLHGRQNESIKVDGEMREKYGYLNGQNDLQNQLLLALVSNAVRKS